MDQIWPPENCGETLSLIRRRARKLLYKTGMPETEQEEVEQHLTVELWLQSRSFDSSQGTWLDFAKARTAQLSLKYVRNRCAKRRDPRRCRSLHVVVHESDGEFLELGDTITIQEARRHRCFESAPPNSHQEASNCLSQVDEALPPNWRDAVAKLDRLSISGLAKATGMKRTTLSSRLSKLRGENSDDFRI